MAVAVVNSKILALNTITTITKNLATADTDSLAEVFTITPTRPFHKGLLIIGGTGSGADDAITYSIAAGDFWAGVAVTGTVAKDTEKMIQVESSKVLQDDGTILLTLTPASGDKLLTNHNAFVKFYEIL